MARLLANAGLVLSSVCLAIAMAVGVLELYLRVADPHDGPMRHPGIYQAHATWGHTYVAGQSFHVSHAEFATDVTTDERGFRGPLRKASDGGPAGPRIVVLGDSFMAGLSIPDGQVFAHYLEARLPRANVWNVAVDGWGTNNQRAALSDLLPQLRPTHVLVAFYENDFYNNAQPIDRYHVVDGHLFDKHCPNTSRVIDLEVIEEVLRRYRTGSLDLNRARQTARAACSPAPPETAVSVFKRFLNDRLRAYPVLVDALKPQLRNLAAILPDARGVIGRLVDIEERHGSGFPSLQPAEIEATRRELSTIREMCDQAGCRVAVMLIPSKWSLALSDAPHVPTAAGIARDLGLYTLDLTEAVKTAGGTALYWNKDGHLRPRGHEVMVETLLRQPWWDRYLQASGDQVPANRPTDKL